MSLNPVIHKTYNISGAGPIAWDSLNNCLWVGTPTCPYAIVSDGAVINGQLVPANTAVAVDTVRGLTWGVGVASNGQYVGQLFNGAEVIDLQAPQPLETTLPGALGVTLDVADGIAWFPTPNEGIQQWGYTNGVLTQLTTLYTPNLNYGFTPTSAAIISGVPVPGLFVVTYNPTGITATTLWFYDPAFNESDKWTWGFTAAAACGVPVYNRTSQVLLVPCANGTVYEWSYTGDLPTIASYALYDAFDAAGGPPTVSYSSAGSAGDVSAVVEQKADPAGNQVLVFYTTQIGPSFQPSPGVTVPNAVNVAVGGGYVWVAGGNTVTAISY